MNKFLHVILLGFFVGACNAPVREEKEDKKVNWKVELLEADRTFSAMSESTGLRNAYLNNIDSNVVLLRPQSAPITGGDAIDFITQGNDSTVTLTWEPKEANIADSGDMGYTYGVYSLKPSAADTIYYGTYVTVWKRQPNGKWKFILHSANEGLE